MSYYPFYNRRAINWRKQTFQHSPMSTVPDYLARVRQEYMQLNEKLDKVIDILEQLAEEMEEEPEELPPKKKLKKAGTISLFHSEDFKKQKEEDKENIDPDEPRIFEIKDGWSDEDDADLEMAQGSD